MLPKEPGVHEVTQVVPSKKYWVGVSEQEVHSEINPPVHVRQAALQLLHVLSELSSH